MGTRDMLYISISLERKKDKATIESRTSAETMQKKGDELPAASLHLNLGEDSNLKLNDYRGDAIKKKRPFQPRGKTTVCCAC